MSDVSSSPVADYKRLLQIVCDNRPSGTRHRLAKALGTNRSFVSQLTNPIYTVPIPVQHLETIFEVCHFSMTERTAFLAAYDRAHPERRKAAEAQPKVREITLSVPDLGSAKRNQQLDDMMAEYARQMARLLSTQDD
ncbi:hypothetical protein GCM10011611_62420 [Aliidongia dinghuensis]|uniref:Uncharacterized protein n=1 Tax=Aliidongia dinghuensis TaxID=1867774 RepID=A0A8J3E6S8_9PROT|nr:hypothetical protein [Aliidongia dinghuensis]GGF47507.1 hypothetical protein GCM10011611_62420 [Aliidongia dinghuensis]